MKSPFGNVRAASDGMHAFDQVEYMSIVSQGALDEMPFKNRKFFTGSNQGNKLGDLKLPRMDGIWKMEPAARKLMYAEPANLWWAEVGGPTHNPDGSTGPGRGAKQIPVEQEPVFWHPSDPLFLRSWPTATACGTWLTCRPARARPP